MAKKQPGKDTAAQAGRKTMTIQPSTSGATGCTGAFTQEQQVVAVISAIMPQLTQVIDRSMARVVRMQPHSNHQTGGKKF